MSAAAKKVAIVRRPISATTSTDPADVVEGTTGDKIELSKAGAADPVSSAERVTVIIPSDYILTRDDGAAINYVAGIAEMPFSDAQHWWSRACGVKIYAPA